ncbi:MAG: Hpt domain-containing protein [Sphingobacteriales bacterium]|nr:MAG: Hpt domain-containing protein [Sphingobacteriales bacterium]
MLGIDTELKEALSTLEKQVAANDITGLKSTGHRLYGTAASTGLPFLALLAREIEQLEGPQNTNWLADLLKKTKLEIELVMNLMQQF